MVRQVLKRRDVLLGGGALALGAVLFPSRILSATPMLGLDEKQLGQLAYIDAVANRLPNDWSDMGAELPGQGGFDSYRYQLAMMSYALALVHYHYTPAWRDRQHETHRKLIEKMLLLDVWSYWELTSRGDIGVNPDLNALGEGWVDPVRFQNIMYSGHLFQMVATHHMLFGAGEYEEPGSILFDYNPVARGLGRQTFSYDIHSLADILVEQFRLNNWRGIECEPNAIFPECNQHPLLGLALYDRLYGTEHFPRISKRFMERFRSLGYLGDNNSYMTFLMVEQDRIIRYDDAWGDGWTGTFLHGWNKAVAERAYKDQHPRFIISLPDGSATIKMPDRRHGYSHGHGFMATAAAEIGDHQSRDALLAYADRYWNPVWEGEALRYPRCDEYSFPGDAANVWRRVQPLTGNGLIGLARMGGRDRIFDMFSRPFDRQRHSEPVLAAVDYPTVQVLTARYDNKVKKLHFTLRPGRTINQPIITQFVIRNISPESSFILSSDGQTVVQSDGDGLKTLGEGLSARWSARGLEINHQLSGKTTIQLALA